MQVSKSGSGLCLVIIIRAGHSPAIVSHVHSDEASLRLSWEVSLWVGSGLMGSMARYGTAAAKVETSTPTM